MLLRDFSNYSEAKILKRTVPTWPDWSSLSTEWCKQIVFYVYNELNKLLNKHAPFKSISKRKKKQLLKPWVTKGIRKSIKIKKNYLYCSGDIAAYKLYRNKALTLTRISKKIYFHKYFEENFTNTKKMW